MLFQVRSIDVLSYIYKLLANPDSQQIHIVFSLTFSQLSNKSTLLLLLAENALERFFDDSNQLAQGSEQVSESKAPAPDAHGIDKEVYEHPVGADEYQENAEVPPFLTSLDVQSREELVADGVGAVLAVVVCIRIEEIATGSLREISGVLFASGAWWGIEVASFGRFAFDWYAGQCGGKNASNPVKSQDVVANKRSQQRNYSPICRWVDVVHPVSPKHWERAVRADHLEDQVRLVMKNVSYG